MAMGTERSKALHNFTMPCDLRWGNQKFLRCMKVNSNGQIPADHRLNRGNSDPPDQRRSVSAELEREIPATGSPSSSGGGRRRKVEVGGSVTEEEKVACDLQAAADGKKESILKDGLEEGEIAAPPPPPPPPPVTAAIPADVRPWNLRTRRSSVKFSPGVGGGSVGLAVEGGGGTRHNTGFAQTRTAPTVVGKSPATGNSGDCGVGTSGEKHERAKFSVSLSKKEIEEDFFAFVGHRPPRRPKKRPRTVQKQLDTLFPGLWLSEVTPDMYKVPDVAP